MGVHVVACSEVTLTNFPTEYIPGSPTPSSESGSSREAIFISGSPVTLPCVERNSFDAIESPSCEVCQIFAF